MSNFFKRLTGSLQMPEEEELFEEENKNESDQTKEAEKPVAEPEQESEIEPAEEELESPQPELETEDEEITSEDDSLNESGDEEPFTVAQLASAKKQPTRTLTSKLRLHKEKATEEENTTTTSMPEGQLAIDVYETPKEIVIKSTIAGVKPGDLDVGIEDNTVNIRGSRHNEEKVKGEDYFYQECYWGTFSRSVILPSEVDSDKAEALLKDGILTVRLPKVLKEREKKIKIIV
jgi:HSP20 family protein